MATETGKESEFTPEAPWISVSPAGLWEVQRRWTEERKKGDDTPQMGSVCKIRVPLDRWVLLRMGEGQCDIVESCLEGMRAGESCEFTVRAYLGNSKLVSSDGTQSEKTEEEGQCFSLHLHSFTPGQESWQMTPAEKWAWVQFHKQRGSQRFGKGDIWGAAQSYCCAVKLIITLKGHTRGKEEDQKEVDRGEDPNKESDLTAQDSKGQEDGEKEAKAIPTEVEYRTMKTELHSNLSLCQLKLGQPAKARASSTKATALDPASVKAWYRLGQACLQLGDFGEARQAFSKVLQLQPDSASARTALKQVNAKAKDLDSKLGQRLSKMFS
ncbi:hypothetical protein AOLI_G00161450 [Acnodon oligacanthus]